MSAPSISNEVFLVRLQDENCEISPNVIAICDTEEYAKKCVAKLNPALEKHERKLRFVIQKHFIVSDPYQTENANETKD